MAATIYLIPTVLAEGKTDPLPAYILDGVKHCQAFFVENERTSRRFLKLLWPAMVIDHYKWYNIKSLTSETISEYKNLIKAGNTIGIISEAGCPGIADPGQKLVHIAQQMNAIVKPLVGPSSILLSLMASGMNGQRFQFVGYLPIENADRSKTIRQLESESRQKDCTQIFIETPYRNNSLLDTLIKTCEPKTLLCIAADITDDNEFIQTKAIQQWRNEKPELHKRPVIFLLYSGQGG